MSGPAPGAWYFHADAKSNVLQVTEPDGCVHVMQMGDWGSQAGAALLSRMAQALSAPQITTEPTT